METNQVIPDLQTTTDPVTPGRGGSDASAAGGAGGASHGHPETFAQRDRAGLANPFVHGEVELAGVTGIALKILQKIRQKKLRQGTDWDVGPSLRVAYGEPGVVALLELATNAKVAQGLIAGVPLTELLGKTRIAPPPVPPSAPTEKITGKVCRLFPNPYLVEIDLGPESGFPSRKVLIRVKENKNLRRGMEVPLKAGKGPSGLELARRLPRFPGKW